MKKRMLFASLLVSVVILFGAVSSYAQSGDMFIESESRYGFEETIKTLSESITNGGWKILTVHNLQESMKKAGKDVLPVQVFEICNPKHSYKLLSQDDKRIYSSLMPCRFSVYEKADGKVYVSRMNTALLSKQIGGLVEEVMTDATNESEGFIKSVLK